MTEQVDHPDHYGGDTDYEVIKVLRAWDLEMAKGFCWGNLIKYTARADKKENELQDREKAQWYACELTSITAELENRRSQTRKLPLMDHEVHVHVEPKTEVKLDLTHLEWD
jgi:hypothetical protein